MHHPGCIGDQSALTIIGPSTKGQSLRFLLRTYTASASQTVGPFLRLGLVTGYRQQQCARRSFVQFSEDQSAIYYKIGGLQTQDTSLSLPKIRDTSSADFGTTKLGTASKMFELLVQTMLMDPATMGVRFFLAAFIVKLFIECLATLLLVDEEPCSSRTSSRCCRKHVLGISRHARCAYWPPCMYSVLIHNRLSYKNALLFPMPCPSPALHAASSACSHPATSQHMSQACSLPTLHHTARTQSHFYFGQNVLSPQMCVFHVSWFLDLETRACPLLHIHTHTLRSRNTKLQSAENLSHRAMIIHHTYTSWRTVRHVRAFYVHTHTHTHWSSKYIYAHHFIYAQNLALYMTSAMRIYWFPSDFHNDSFIKKIKFKFRSPSALLRSLFSAFRTNDSFFFVLKKDNHYGNQSTWPQPWEYTARCVTQYRVACFACLYYISIKMCAHMYTMHRCKLHFNQHICMHVYNVHAHVITIARLSHCHAHTNTCRYVHISQPRSHYIHVGMYIYHIIFDGAFVLHCVILYKWLIFYVCMCTLYVVRICMYVCTKHIVHACMHAHMCTCIHDKKRASFVMKTHTCIHTYTQAGRSIALF
jgi:hypothetical protein